MNLLVLVVDDEPDVEMLFRQQFRRDLRLGRFTMEFAQSGDNDERKFNEMAAPIEGKHDAPWLKRSKSASGVEEVRVIDLDRGVERQATPEEIERGIEYQDYDHFKEGKAA